jgi:hypothetical protein
VVAGGVLDDFLMPPAETAESFDPETGRWSQAGLVSQGWMHTATSLGGGWVLLAGGNRDDVTVESTRLYDRRSGGWVDTGTLISPRYGHLAMPIPGHGVLLVGGKSRVTPAPYYSSVPVERLELFHVATWTWKEVAAVNELPTSARNYYSATPLADGSVLLIGHVEGKRAVQLRYEESAR